MVERYMDVTSELRRSSAAMGMVFFGLKYGKTIPNLEKYMEDGISVCDVIIEGRKVPKTGVPKYEDRAVRDAFVRVAQRGRSQRGKAADEPEMVKKAEAARKTLEHLKDRETVSEQDLDASAEFFRKVYSAI